jgi:hypothetical protein
VWEIIAYRQLQYERQNWASIVSTGNFEIESYEERCKKENVIKK